MDPTSRPRVDAHLASDWGRTHTVIDAIDGKPVGAAGHCNWHLSLNGVCYPAECSRCGVGPCVSGGAPISQRVDGPAMPPKPRPEPTEGADLRVGHHVVDRPGLVEFGPGAVIARIEGDMGYVVGPHRSGFRPLANLSRVGQ